MLKCVKSRNRVGPFKHVEQSIDVVNLRGACSTLDAVAMRLAQSISLAQSQFLDFKMTYVAQESPTTTCE